MILNNLILNLQVKLKLTPMVQLATAIVNTIITHLIKILTKT